MLKGILCIFAVVLISSYASARTGAAQNFEFVMRFMGSCNTSGMTYTCLGKGNSQTLTTIISSTEAVKFNVTELIGAYAFWDNDGTLDNSTGKYSEEGHFSFGTHLDRNHELSYSSLGFVGRTVQANGMVVATIDSQIVGGTGAFNGTQGVVSQTCRLTPDLVNSICYVSVIATVVM